MSDITISGITISDEYRFILNETKNLMDDLSLWHNRAMRAQKAGKAQDMAEALHQVSIHAIDLESMALTLHRSADHYAEVVTQ